MSSDLQHRLDIILKNLNMTNEQFQKEVVRMTNMLDSIPKMLKLKTVRELQEKFQTRTLNAWLIQKNIAPRCNIAVCKSQCCHDVIRCSVPEAEEIAAYINQTKLEFDRERLKANAKLTYRQLKQLSFINKKCPFLVDNRCVIYTIRPLVCRNHVVTMDSDCNQDFVNLIPPDYGFILFCAVERSFGPQLPFYKKILSLLE
jgi:Fe-S-cluster containining protein